MESKIKYEPLCKHDFVEWRGRSICVECGITELELDKQNP